MKRASSTTSNRSRPLVRSKSVERDDPHPHRYRPPHPPICETNRMNATGTDQNRVSRVLVERYLDRLRKRRRWRRLSVTITVFLCLLVLAGYSVLWHTKVLDVRSTTVSGV